MEKNWLDISDYENLYKVSNYGDIFSYYCQHLISQADNGKGYKFVWLSKNGIKKRFYVHRLVANEFIPNPDNKPQVNHKDCNKGNNLVSNLEWVDLREQMNHASISGTKSHLSKLNDIQVLAIRKIKQHLNYSNQVIADFFGVNRETVGYIIRGKTWKHLL